MDISSLVEVKRNPKIPDITPGDTIRVSAKIVESGKERIQVFQGVVIKMRKGGVGASFTVRHVAYGIGVERTFPIYSPLVEKVEVVRQGKVRRSRLYYLRGLSGKAARRKIRRVERKGRKIGEEVLEPEPAEEPEEIMEAVVGQEEAEAEEAPVQEEAVAEAPVVEEERPVEPAPEPEAAKEEKAEPVREKEPEVEKTAESVEEPEQEKETP